MEKKPNKTWAIVGTVAAVLFCGCPGLFACIFGILIAVGVPIKTTVNGYSTTQALPIYYGIGLLCLSIIFIAIPIVVGVLTLRKKKAAPEAAAEEVLPPQEPLPPAS